MIKINVVGICGRMGKTIATCILDTPNAAIAGGTEIPGHPQLGEDLSLQYGNEHKGLTITDNLDSIQNTADVTIDFSLPESSMKTLASAVNARKAVVFGTTGFSPEQKKAIEDASKTIPIVLAPNMSIGVNVLFKIIVEAARALGDDYDVEIVEAHHKFKKDAPSGTAVRISEILADTLDRNLEEVGIYGRRGMSDGRGDKEIGIHTVRAGDIIGEHRVLYGGMGESLEIMHRAQSRDTFARGSIKAAQWIVGREPGLYDMQDVLGLNSA